MAPSRLPLILSIGAACFAAGVVTSHLVERSARAASESVTPSVYVPPDGLVFRTYDGHIVARLGYDLRGGHFVVYDRNERPVAQLKADGNIDASQVSLALPLNPLNPLDMRIK